MKTTRDTPEEEFERVWDRMSLYLPVEDIETEDDLKECFDLMAVGKYKRQTKTLIKIGFPEWAFKKFVKEHEIPFAAKKIRTEKWALNRGRIQITSTGLKGYDSITYRGKKLKVVRYKTYGRVLIPKRTVDRYDVTKNKTITLRGAKKGVW